MPKIRLDEYLVNNDFADDIDSAKRIILSGIVFRKEERLDKAGMMVKPDDEIFLKDNHSCKYVSRGGLKLEAAINDFKINISNKICADVGASTGGFTDCLIQHGAGKVYAIDVGKSNIHEKLRNNPNVILIENQNARYLDESTLPEKINLAAIDVSFISLKTVLPAVKKILNQNSEIIALIKPQFESSYEESAKGQGIIDSKEIHERIIAEISDCAKMLDLNVIDIIQSPVKKSIGNIEYLIYLKRGIN